MIITAILHYLAFAGAMATVVTYPFDLLRTRFALQGSGDQKVWKWISSSHFILYIYYIYNQKKT